MVNGKRYAGAAVVSPEQKLWTAALPHGALAQKAELIALTKVLQMAKGKTANIYTDSRHAFATLHIHGAIYKERGLLTAEGKGIKNRREILALFQAIWDPKEVAVMHCPGHQKGTDLISKGNHLADQAAKQAARETVQELVTLPAPALPEKPNYSEEYLKYLQKWVKLDYEGDWAKTETGKIILP